MSCDKGAIVLLTTALQGQNVWFYRTDDKIYCYSCSMASGWQNLTKKKTY